MFNHQKPSIDELPSSKQLLKSTFLALITAVIIIFTIVLPSEYGVDPTGAGEFLGLKSMGSIKVSLEKEALTESESKTQAVEAEKPSMAEPADKNAEIKTDYIEKTLAPGEAIEIKLEMAAGAMARYSWSTANGRLNFNVHGDGYKGTNKSITYKKGRMVTADEGEIIAAFDGLHGWFWRNREDTPVTIKLDTSGNYKQLKIIL